MPVWVCVLSVMNEQFDLCERCRAASCDLWDSDSNNKHSYIPIRAVPLQRLCSVCTFRTFLLLLASNWPSWHQRHAAAREAGAVQSECWSAVRHHLTDHRRRPTWATCWTSTSDRKAGSSEHHWLSSRSGREKQTPEELQRNGTHTNTMFGDLEIWCIGRHFSLATWNINRCVAVNESSLRLCDSAV